jgi:hypothetical protein
LNVPGTLMIAGGAGSGVDVRPAKSPDTCGLAVTSLDLGGHGTQTTR